MWKVSLCWLQEERVKIYVFHLMTRVHFSQFLPSRCFPGTFHKLPTNHCGSRVKKTFSFFSYFQWHSFGIEYKLPALADILEWIDEDSERNDGTKFFWWQRQKIKENVQRTKVGNYCFPPKVCLFPQTDWETTPRHELFSGESARLWWENRYANEKGHVMITS